MLPIKTGDFVRVDDGNTLALVVAVNMTSDGPILEVYKIDESPITLHADEVVLNNPADAAMRTKSVGKVVVNFDQRITVPNGVSKSQARKMLNRVARELAKSGRL